MAYNQLDFESSPSNVGQKYSPKEDLGRNIKYVLTPLDFQFATKEEALTESNWQDAIEQVASRIFPMPYIYENEDTSGEATMQEFTGGDSLTVREGSYGERSKLFISVADMVKLYSYKNKKWRLFEIDENGNIMGTSPDGTVFQGFELSEFNVQKMDRTGGDVKRLVPVTIKHREPTEWMKYAAVINPLKQDTDAWDARDLDGLIDVELTVESQTSSKIVVSAEAYLKGVDLAGFDQVSDWVLKDAAGDAQTITTVTDNNDGTYDLEGTGLVTGTINLAASADLSQDGYESTGAKDVTIA